MGVRAIFDTNVVIYLQKGLLARPLPRGEYFISVISELELRSFHGLDAANQEWLDAFLSDIAIVELDGQIKENAVRLRRDHRLRLPDAIIAASALACHAILLTNDQRLLAIPDVQSQAVELKHE
jgi:predicted nucleic acid-binding protein